MVDPADEAKDQAEKVKEAIAELDRATRPVVREVLSLVQKSITEGASAAHTAGANIDKIADAAVRLASAQVDLMASGHQPPSANRPNNSTLQRRKQKGKE